MRIIKLMADYGCFPLWEASPGHIGNIDPATLPISSELNEALSGWAFSYDATLDIDDPVASKFASKDDENGFMLEGEKLQTRLRDELGGDYEVFTLYLL